MRRSTRTRDAGATTVEFALVLPVMLILISGVLSFGLAMTYAGLAEYGASVGLRKAVIRTSGGYPGDAVVRTTIGDALSGLLPTPTNTDVLTRNAGDRAARTGRTRSLAQGDRVTVRVVYTVPGVTAALGLLPDSGFQDAMIGLATVERTAVGRLE